MSKLTSSTLLAKSLSGQSEALNALIDRYRPYLLRLANERLDSAVKQRVDASDVVQQTCLEVYRDFDAFEGNEEAQFVAWLKRILHHNMANTVRHHVQAGKRTTKRDRSLDDNLTPLLARPTTKRHSCPSVRMIRAEEFRQLGELLETLPVDQREAVRLKHLEGWSLRQLAQHLNRTEVAVAGLLKRGMKTLRNRVEEENSG